MDFRNTISLIFSISLSSCILDGEMMVMDMDTLTYEPFGALKTANNEATAKGADSRRRPVFFVFDMVFFNGHRMVDLPLRERYQHLTAAVSTKQGVLEITQHVEASTADDVLKALDQCILRREEGILSKQGEGESQNRFFCLTNQSLLVKHPLSSYLVASREHYWCKLKPENLPGISETFDVVVVGGQYGSGRRGGKLSHFIVAVLDDSPDAADKPPRFITAGRVGGGYEDRLLDTMLAKMEPYWKDYDRSNPPSWFIHAPKGEQPDKVIHPENSVIMEIMCSEIVPSVRIRGMGCILNFQTRYPPTFQDHFAVGHTYRFPRCKSVREDKSWRDIEPLTKFREMSLGGILLKSSASAHYANLNNNSQSANTGFKRRKVFNSSSIAKRIPTVGADNLGADVRGVQVTSRILEGIEFCVFDFIQPVAVDYNDRDQHQQAPLAKTKHEMERIIKAYGGTFVQNPVPERTTYVIADRKGKRKWRGFPSLT